MRGPNVCSPSAGPASAGAQVRTGVSPTQHLHRSFPLPQSTRSSPFNSAAGGVGNSDNHPFCSWGEGVRNSHSTHSPPRAAFDCSERRALCRRRVEQKQVASPRYWRFTTRVHGLGIVVGPRAPRTADRVFGKRRVPLNTALLHPYPRSGLPPIRSHRANAGA